MNGPIKRVAVLGLGRIGGLVGTLLQRAGFEVTGFDIVLPEDKLAFKAAKKCLGSEDADRSTLGNFDINRYSI